MTAGQFQGSPGVIAPCFINSSLSALCMVLRPLKYEIFAFRSTRGFLDEAKLFEIRSYSEGHSCRFIMRISLDVTYPGSPILHNVTQFLDFCFTSGTLAADIVLWKIPKVELYSWFAMTSSKI